MAVAIALQDSACNLPLGIFLFISSVSGGRQVKRCTVFIADVPFNVGMIMSSVLERSFACPSVHDRTGQTSMVCFKYNAVI